MVCVCVRARLRFRCRSVPSAPAAMVRLSAAGSLAAAARNCPSCWVQLQNARTSVQSRAGARVRPGSWRAVGAKCFASPVRICARGENEKTCCKFEKSK
eukprot:3390671-Pyramimonas_sp.AAC.1